MKDANDIDKRGGREYNKPNTDTHDEARMKDILPSRYLFLEGNPNARSHLLSNARNATTKTTNALFPVPGSFEYTCSNGRLGRTSFEARGLKERREEAPPEKRRSELQSLRSSSRVLCEGGKVSISPRPRYISSSSTQMNQITDTTTAPNFRPTISSPSTSLSRAFARHRLESERKWCRWRRETKETEDDNFLEIQIIGQLRRTLPSESDALIVARSSEKEEWRRLTGGRNEPESDLTKSPPSSPRSFLNNDFDSCKLALPYSLGFVKLATGYIILLIVSCCIVALHSLRLVILPTKPRAFQTSDSVLRVFGGLNSLSPNVDRFHDAVR
ncbi:hypothetical protein SISSUDRAFT_525300 [Sistotremastrum suecicum HHB10207 ss-3]|uniref:Uncharacterized protein n=1 Tax=Sistotremastrum suecicum HHB10207 ss-3 TaxID=1314776 RepID=A0A166F6G3_9AGAM|nr:hypothetical protein SISSUDRAFT_525300 [Sistotremastrum suecicum HHB10207 ss-3]